MVPINAQNRSLPDWFSRIRTHQTVLPRFQRFEAWNHSDVTQLFNTILQGLPVGAVLVLDVGNEEPFVSRTLAGAPATGERVTEQLLDGQQRLTALWRGLHNNYEDRTYFLVLKPDEETGMPYYVDSVVRWRNESDKELRPLWANRPEEQWERRMIPLDLCRPDEEAAQLFQVWRKQAIRDLEEREHVSDTVAEIRQKFATFNLPYLALPVKTPKETALDVFIKMNTSAAPLSAYDIVVAQVEGTIGKSLHDLVADTREACPNIAYYYPPEDLALAAGALLQGRPPTNRSYLAKDFGEQLIGNWKNYLAGVRRAVDFLEEEGIYDAARLPTEVVVPVLVALWATAPKGLDAEGRARTTLRKYIWRAFFTSRYEKTTTSRSLVDYNELRSVIMHRKAPTPVIFNDSLYPLPEPRELMAAGWPTKKDRLARAILALALKHGGLDLADGSPVNRDNLRKREYHHLFPEAYLKKLGVDDNKIYRALNCALVTWNTNRAISSKEPERYLAERLEGSNLGEAEIRVRLASHVIPYDELKAGDYDRFLARRAELIHGVMLKYCSGEPG